MLKLDGKWKWECSKEGEKKHVEYFDGVNSYKKAVWNARVKMG
jgi:hypothetical protein